MTVSIQRPSRDRSLLRCAVAIGALLLATSPVARASDLRPVPSGWNLTLEWSPEYCHRNRANDERQCSEAHHFIVSRLQPRFQGAAPPCRDAQLTSQQIEQAHLDIPNRELIRRMWSVDGACSGLQAADYLAQLGRATRRFPTPDALKSVQGRQALDQAKLQASFASFHPEFAEMDLIPRCEGQYLVEVQICVTEAFEPTRCERAQASNCPAEFQVRGSPKSRLRPAS